MNDYVLSDDGKHALFNIGLAYAGSIKTDRYELKKLISAMVVEYVNRGDLTKPEKENIWDELIDLSIEYMEYCKKYVKENKDER